MKLHSISIEMRHFKLYFYFIQGDVVAHRGDVVIDSAPDFWGRGPRFQSGISHKDPDALQDHIISG